MALGVGAGVVGAVIGSDGNRLKGGLVLPTAGFVSSAASATVAKTLKNSAAQSSCSKKRFREGLSDAK